MKSKDLIIILAVVGMFASVSAFSRARANNSPSRLAFASILGSMAGLAGAMK